MNHKLGIDCPLGVTVYKSLNLVEGLVHFKDLVKVFLTKRGSRNWVSWEHY